MNRRLAPEIRAALLAAPDGLTARQLAAALNITPTAANKTAAAMPDVYIDRWETGPARPPAAVYIAVPVPADCPRPGK